MNNIQSEAEINNPLFFIFLLFFYSSFSFAPPASLIWAA